MALKWAFRHSPRQITCLHRTAVWIGQPRSTSARRRCTAASEAAAHAEPLDEGCVVDWDYVGEGTPDAAIAEAWDYRHMDETVVEANLADAEAYRMLVLRLPKTLPNIKDLRAFRDNVTRKLAPAIARALFAQLSCAGGAAELVAGLAAFASYHLSSFIVDRPTAIPLFSGASSGPSGGATPGLTQHTAHATSNSGSAVHGVSQTQTTNAAEHFSGAVPDLGEHSLPAHLGRRRRWGNRGSSRRSLAGAGRRGLMDSDEATDVG